MVQVAWRTCNVRRNVPVYYEALSFASEHTVATVCPLDCPDSCSLDVTVQDGRVTVIDGSHLNPVTGGYICAKVRRFSERVYGPDRLLYPAVRKGPKGLASFERVSWDDALGSDRRAAARGARRSGVASRSCPTRTAARTGC